MANNAVETAMQERADAAKAAVLRSDPKATNLTVSIANGQVIVDYHDHAGEPQRVQHVEDDDILAAEQAEAGAHYKIVTYGKKLA